MQWIAANMNDVLDAYAEHVYWTYDDAADGSSTASATRRT